jgi:precorrin-6Y C5,15-methyltransferase (decarboxylating)
MSRPWLTVVGIGEDGVPGLSEAARYAIIAAALVAGGSRHLALADGLIRGERLPWPSPMDTAYPTLMARRGEAVVVLASGDPFCWGVGAALAGLVDPGEMACIPMPSAFAMARARLGWAVAEVAELSLCGRPIEGLIGYLQPGAKVIALSSDDTTPGLIAAMLRARGFGKSIMHVMEALGGPRERVRRGAAEDFGFTDINRLNLVAVEGHAAPEARIVPLTSGLPDELFEHDGQFTRREMRALTLSSLAPRRGETLWDIGAGAGSVGIEWMLRHPANRAIAIEGRQDRAARIARNAASLGVPALRIVEGRAPDALAGLPEPNAVFIGGGAHVPGVIDTAWSALPSQGRIVANAVTLETEAALTAARARLGGTLLRVGIERLDAVGTMHAYRPAMTVTQWSAVKP